MAQPAEVQVIIYKAKGVITTDPVHVNIKVGREKFKTDDAAAEDGIVKWNEDCTGHLRKHKKPKSELLELSLKTAKGTKLGVISVALSSLKPAPFGVRWAEFEPHKDYPAGMSLAFDCWVKKYHPGTRALHDDHPLVADEHSNPGTPPRAAKRLSVVSRHAPLHGSAPDLSKMETLSLSPSRRSSAASSVSDASSIASSSAPMRQHSWRDKLQAPSSKRHKRSVSNDTVYSVTSAHIEPLAADEVPEIKELLPHFGPVTGGTLLSITGKYLGRSIDDFVVLSLGDYDCRARFTFVSPKLIRLVTPACPNSGPLRLSIETRSGGVLECSSTFTYERREGDTVPTGMKPEVSGVSPLCGPAGGFTPVKIRGDHLGTCKEDILSLTICGIECKDTIVSVSPHLIECVTRAGSGAGAIVVITKQGGPGYSLVQYVYDRRLRMKSQNEQAARLAAPELEIDASMSKDKLLAEISALNHQVDDLKEENTRLHSYVDKLLQKILTLQPSGEILMTED